MTVLRLLHIDDEPDIREIVAISLGLDPAFKVRSCACGEDGLAAAAADMPDLILLDVMMPVMDGPTTLVRLRENPRTAAIPVIFMTARAGSREIEEFKSLGAAGVIAKPFDPMTLAASVRSHAPPIMGMLAVARRMFAQRVGRDTDTLSQCRAAALGHEVTLPSRLARIRDVAHGLAGTGGILGFGLISDAAASLEEAAIIELCGAGAPHEVERALEHLLTMIAASHLDQIDHHSPSSSAAEAHRR